MTWHNWQSYNWEKYNLPREVPPPGQLLMYPVMVQVIILFLTYYTLLQLDITEFLITTTLNNPTLFFLQPNGKLENLPNFASFPDYPSTAKVFGAKSGMIPEKVTT